MMLLLARTKNSYQKDKPFENCAAVIMMKLAKQAAVSLRSVSPSVQATGAASQRLYHKNVRATSLFCVLISSCCID